MNINKISNHDLPHHLSDNIWLLGNYYFNIYYIKGQNASALIETGISAIADALIGQLDSINEKPDYIVATHPHADHITGLAALMKRYPEAKVVIGHETCEFLNHPKASEMLFYEDRHMTETLFRKGVITEHRPIDRLPSLENSIQINDCENIDLGGTTLSILTVKGHSPGNINVYIPQGEVLIASDSLGFHYPGRGFLPLFFTGFQDYLDTIDRLASYSTKILAPGHQGPIKGPDVREAFHESRRAAVDMKNLIQAASENLDMVFKQLYHKFYKDELTLYSKENIKNCCRLLIKRVGEF